MPTTERHLTESFPCPVSGNLERLEIRETVTTKTSSTREAMGMETGRAVRRNITNCSGIGSCGVETRHAQSSTFDWSRCPRMATLNTGTNPAS